MSGGGPVHSIRALISSAGARAPAAHQWVRGEHSPHAEWDALLLRVSTTLALLLRMGEHPLYINSNASSFENKRRLAMPANITITILGLTYPSRV